MKYDKKNMERKLIEIRNELKVFTLSGNVTSQQQLERLGREIEELKYENRNLSNNVMDLMPDDGHDPRQHDRNNKDSNSI